MADTYRNFEELKAREAEGREWRREYRRRPSKVLVMAPHGGWIEPFTAELAEAVAGDDLSFYAFRGLKTRNNGTLHLTSHRFDEPVALEAVARADRVLCIHGERCSDRSFVMVGGGDGDLQARLARELEEAGFVLETPRQGLQGRNPRNICNRGRSGAGGQLELSEALRRTLRHDPQRLGTFVGAVRRALLAGGPDSRSGKLRPPQPPGWNSRPL